jgi:hypothetical protein
MKIKGLFMKIVVFNEIATCVLCSNQKSKFKHVIIQFRLHNIHIVGENTLKGDQNCCHIVLFFTGPMFELQPCHYYEGFSQDFHIL